MSKITKVETTEDGFILLNGVVKTRLVGTNHNGESFFDIIYDKETMSDTEANALLDNFIELVATNEIDDLMEEYIPNV